MQTIPETTTTRKPPVAFYALNDERNGIILQADGQVSFLDDTTQVWEAVPLETLTTFVTLLGRLDIADAQALADGDRVRTCSRTLQHVA